MSDADNAYWREYRQRPEVKARERERARKRRAAPGGAETNRARVKANRARLGRNYITELLRDATGVRCRDVPPEIVEMKRDALEFRRASQQLALTAKEATPDEA